MFKKWALILAVTASVFVGGCRKGDFNLVDHIVFEPSNNLETVKVSLVFTQNITTNLAAGFLIKDYGLLFINPHTQTSPFEIGFALNTNIVNDQDYIKLTPTEVLPNGIPIGIDYALAEVRSPTPINPKFDIYGYVDVLHQAWLGAAAIFGFIDNQNFPDGLSISQVFLRDTQGRPGVIASVFGPSTSADGSVKRAGGIALFANVKQLLAGQRLKPGYKLILRPELNPYLGGPRAVEYERDYRELRRLELNLVRGFNQY
jgi:hypothetical protein